MNALNKSALLGFSASRVFDLVADIESYPEYLPGCVGSTILESSQTEVVARLDLEHYGIRQSFTTRNVMTPYDAIALHLIEGPFDCFQGEWKFQSLGESASKVSLNLKFSTRQKFVALAAGRLLQRVGNDMVGALTARAVKIYGKSQ